MDELLAIMGEIDIPSAYDHFAEGEAVDPPFITYLLPGSDNFSAVERKVEAVLDEHGIFYDKTEVWIDTEKLYEVLYSFQMEG